MSHTSSPDLFFLRETFKLAKKGLSWTNPNPMVGAVIVKDGKIKSRGFHQRVGLPHAEIEALNKAKSTVKGATLYVNLEPCTHYGRTPPCVDAIIQAGIKRVVCSILDPNPKVRGRGIAKLEQAGITVSVGLREKESRALNETFFTFHEKERPFVAIKFAASLDGKIATKTGDSKWITNKKARNFTMSLWAKYQSVLVGINTVLKDDEPMRLVKKQGKNPLRIVLDSSLRIPINSQIFWDKNVLIATSDNQKNQEKKVLFEKMGVTILSFPSPRVPLQALMRELYKREIISILVEGGGSVLGSFLDERLVDKIYAFHSPILLGGEKAISAIAGKGIKTIEEAIILEQVRRRHFGNNTLTVGYPKWSKIC